MLCSAVVCVVGRGYVSVEVGLRVLFFCRLLPEDTCNILGFSGVGEQVSLLFVTRRGQSM